MFSQTFNSIVKCQHPQNSVAESHHQDQCSNYFTFFFILQEGIVDSGLAQSEKRYIWVALTEGGKNKNYKTHAEKPLTPHWFTSLRHLHSCHSLCVHCCAYGWCGNAQLAKCTLMGPSRSLLPATESQYEIWHHNGRMTKTISADSLNFTNLYLLSYFLSSSIHRKYLHNNTGMNG